MTFTVPTGDYDQISLVSYNAPGGVLQRRRCEPPDGLPVGHAGLRRRARTRSASQLPNNFYQVDFVCGTVITTLGPANRNNFYHAQNRYIDGDNGGVNPAGSGELSVTGEVYNDLNVNGKLDSGDRAIANVTVTLAGTDLYGNAISETTTTNGSGVYSFSGLPFSNSTGYAVSVSPPSGYSSGAATVGTVNSAADGTATTSPEGVEGIVLGSSTQTTGTGYNLGLITSSDLAGSTDSIVVLSPTASGALTVSGSAKVTRPRRHRGRLQLLERDLRQRHGFADRLDHRRRGRLPEGLGRDLQSRAEYGRRVAGRPSCRAGHAEHQRPDQLWLRQPYQRLKDHQPWHLHARSRCRTAPA